MSLSNFNSVDVGVCSQNGAELTTVTLAVLDGRVAITLVEANDDPFGPFVSNGSGESIRVELRRWPEHKPHFVSLAGESNSRMMIGDEAFVLKIATARMVTYHITVWREVCLDKSFPVPIREMMVPVSHHLILVAGSLRYTTLIGRGGMGLNPLVQRFLEMSFGDHETSLGRLQASTEPVDEEECQAAKEAMRIRLEMAHIGSGETSDHPEVDGRMTSGKKGG